MIKLLNRLKLRWKLLALVLPLVIVPIILIGLVVGYIANRQAYLGVTKASKYDLEHIAIFTIDLLNVHHQQFEVYKQERLKNLNNELATLTNLSYNLVESEYKQFANSRPSPDSAKREARNALKKINVGETGYIYAITSKGKLEVHIAREGDNIYDEQDNNGRYFIREMCRAALVSKPGEVLFISYPWQNVALGDKAPRIKVVAYRYFREWDWIIATGGYLEEAYNDKDFEKKSFAVLKENLRSKKVGATGYIYCMDSKGKLTVHPDLEGQNIIDAKDSNGNMFIREMCEKKSGWIRYPWKNAGSSAPRMKIVRYEYFRPWDWIVAVGSYEDEFYHEAQSIKKSIMVSMAILIVAVGITATIMVFKASTIISNPISHMIDVIRRIKRGNPDERMHVEGDDELSEMAGAFNRMTDKIRRNSEIETKLSQQGKMASLGILSSGVAHEINNPLGVILGYAGYLEGKMSEDDPNYEYIHEIKRESKRCRKIVQDLLSYARTPRPVMEPCDINELMEQIVGFAANHTDMRGVAIRTEFSPDLPKVCLDGDQMRQVAINLILNAGGAMPDGGTLSVTTKRADSERVNIIFSDNGCGIPPEDLEKIFEPFYTTKERGTGLGLAITRQIIEQHSGEIRIESRESGGTTITVTLPVEHIETDF
ncbi:MAG: cache domain-containing protein [Desulfuromonadaceae bacterium]|nr:cache domain-containing protein [Desulfuromonadaceae bacterium]